MRVGLDLNRDDVRSSLWRPSLPTTRQFSIVHAGGSAGYIAGLMACWTVHLPHFLLDFCVLVSIVIIVILAGLRNSLADWGRGCLPQLSVACEPRIDNVLINSSSKFLALIYDILFFFEEGAGKRCSECAATLDSR